MLLKKKSTLAFIPSCPTLPQKKADNKSGNTLCSYQCQTRGGWGRGTPGICGAFYLDCHPRNLTKSLGSRVGTFEIFYKDE